MDAGVAERVLTFIRNTRGRHSTGELVRRFGGTPEEMRAALMPLVERGQLGLKVKDGKSFWTLG